MRSVNVKLWSCIGSLIVMAMMIIGCGSGNDLLDEVGQRYSVDIAMIDNDETTHSIDIARDLCDTDWEPYGPTIAEVTVSVASDAPGITLQSYTIDYIPQLSPDGSGATVMPTSLESALPGVYNIDIPSGGSGIFTLTAISTDTKEEYREEQGWNWVASTYWVPPALDEGRYTVQFTFYFLNTEGQTETITKSTTVWFGDFDNC